MGLSTFRIALRAIGANRLRSTLTMLGVMVGICAVITLQAIGQGQKRAQLELYEKMGANRLMVWPGASRHNGEWHRSQMELDDAEALLAASTVAQISPISDIQGRVKYMNNTIQTSIMGVLPEYFTVENYEVVEGTAFDASAVLGWERVAVLGSAVATDLFGGRSPVGESIRIDGKYFEVIGVLKEKGALPWYDPDQQVVVPLTTVQHKLGGGKDLSQVTLQTRSVELGEQAEEEITAILQERFPAFVRDDRLYHVMNAAQFQEEAEKTSKSIQLFLMVVGAVSLFIGGVGIMNIMLVTVTERTREIGLRKALGATAPTIVGQFLTEAIVLCLGAGLLGIAVSLVITAMMANASERIGFPAPVVQQGAIVVAFLVSVSVGIVFGTTPALKAAKLEPMQALRHE